MLAREILSHRLVGKTDQTYTGGTSSGRRSLGLEGGEVVRTGLDIYSPYHAFCFFLNSSTVCREEGGGRGEEKVKIESDVSI